MTTDSILINYLVDFHYFWPFSTIFLLIFAIYMGFWTNTMSKLMNFMKSKFGGGEKKGNRNQNNLSSVNESSSLSDNEDYGQQEEQLLKSMDRRNIAFTSVHGQQYIDEDPDHEKQLILNKSSDSRPSPQWLDGPRDITALPDIIATTYSDYTDEADYAMKQMLAILETLNPVEENMELFENSLKAIAFRLPFDLIMTEEKKPDWNKIRHKLIADSMTLTPITTSDTSEHRRGLSCAQMSAVFDAIPFLFDAVACNHELSEYQNILSMIVIIAMTGNSMIRRQSINAIQALMERSMLSQDFMREGVVPGLFHIYQSGVGVFQSNDLRMECVQALCQVISYDTIHDRRWLFENFLPRFSQMLKDPTMHVRKSALHIFGNLGQMFGQKFTEVFLVPHLITLSCDMTWAVRKVACEIFVKVAECAPNDVRVETLSPNFVRLLNDPNKWVSFIAYQQLGPFISLFANPAITGLELKNGQIIVREVPKPSEDSTISSDDVTTTLNTTFVSETTDDQFGTLPPNTWLPEVDLNDDFEYQLAMNEVAVSQYQRGTALTATVTTPTAKTPKRGERVMDSVLSGINKMFGPFERSSPKAKETEKIAATFSSPSKRSTLSLHGAVSLMDKWSKRSNPNNPQRFPVFDHSSSSSDGSSPNSSKKSVQKMEQTGGSGIAAKCNSTDDLTKLGLEDDVSTSPAITAAAAGAAAAETTPEKDGSSSSSSSESRVASPRGRRIATNAWGKLDIRQKLFLRRLGALPPVSVSASSSSSSSSSKVKKVMSPVSPTRKASASPMKMIRKGGGATTFEFAMPNELGATSPASAKRSWKTRQARDEARRGRFDLQAMSKAMSPMQYAMDTKKQRRHRESDEDSDSEDEPDDFDKSFVADDEDDAPLTIDVKSGSNGGSSESVSPQGGATAVKEPVSNEFSLTYWSSNYAIESIEDELKPFGSSCSFTNSPTSNSYLESRFDVMKVNGGCSPRARSQSFGTNGSPIALSPRRKANSTCEAPAITSPLGSSPPTTAALDTSKSDESVVMLNTEEKEKLGILDLDDLNMSMSSNSSTQGEAAMTEESDVSMVSLEHSAFQHVPLDLVESYMKVMGPPGQQGGGVVATGDASLCAEIYRHCAHNFPAVCYTLGRAAWPKLKLVFRKLAMDEQARVRQSISYSIHEIANMLGQEITDEDLLPVFYELRNDQNIEVRSGILLHLYDFVKCLSLEKRDEMILSLPQFFPIGAQPGNQTQNGDWRSRFELISQLSKLCSLYSTQDVNFHMSGIALTLADDRVAEVRREAVQLVSTIVGALVSAEWHEIRVNRDIDNGHLDPKSSRKERAKTFLSEQFVDDIVSSFAKTQKWTRRQTFCFICAQILRDRQCDGIQFRYFFATPLQQLVQDRVPNVRLASCEAMSVWRKTLIAARSQERRGQSPISSPSSEPTTLRRDINMVSDMMVKLSNDSDIDAAYLAKKCQGLTDDQQPVDVDARTARMREREEQFFGDLVLTDPSGCLVRVVDKVVKQVIRPASTRSTMNIPVETTSTTEIQAPIQTMEEFDDEILNQTESMNISTPPEMCAVVQRLQDQEDSDDVVGEIQNLPLPEAAAAVDNTDEVDMEIDDEDVVVEADADDVRVPENLNPESVAAESEDVPMEGDVPMDPAPSAPKESPPKDHVITTSSPNESDA